MNYKCPTILQNNSPEKKFTKYVCKRRKKIKPNYLLIIIKQFMWLWCYGFNYH